MANLSILVVLLVIPSNLLTKSVFFGYFGILCPFFSIYKLFIYLLNLCKYIKERQLGYSIFSWRYIIYVW